MIHVLIRIQLFLLLRFPLNHLGWEYCSPDFRLRAFCPRHIQMSGLFFLFVSLKPCEAVIRRPLWGFKHYGCCHFMSLGRNESLRYIWAFLFERTQILLPLDGSARLKDKGLADTLAYTAVYACVFMSVCTVRVCFAQCIFLCEAASACQPPVHRSTSASPPLFFSSSHIPVCLSGLGKVQFWM